MPRPGLDWFVGVAEPVVAIIVLEPRTVFVVKVLAVMVLVRRPEIVVIVVLLTLPLSGTASTPVAVPIGVASIASELLTVAVMTETIEYGFGEAVLILPENTDTTLSSPSGPEGTSTGADGRELSVAAGAIETCPLSRSKTTYMLVRNA